MLGLRVCTKPTQVLSAYRALGVIQPKRNGHWLPDYKPGPVPKTEEERIAAAKKYNLLPEEYECYGEDETGYGDYPKLPYESVDSRDPWYPWDNEELRKDFNEPVNVKLIIALPETTSTGPIKDTYLRGTRNFLMLTCAFGAIGYVFYQFKIVHPVGEKQYPTAGVTHYTFEPDLVEAARRAKKKYACRELGEGEDVKEGEKRMEE